jgi:hypothetical protein
MILTFALTLALSLPSKAQTREERCINVLVELDVSVVVGISVNVTLDVDGNVNLSWQTDREPDTAGFNVYQAGREGPYTQINDDLIQPQHDRGSGDSYTFVDKPDNDLGYTFVDKSSNDLGYYYMLESIDSNGKRNSRALVYMSKP